MKIKAKAENTKVEIILWIGPKVNSSGRYAKTNGTIKAVTPILVAVIAVRSGSDPAMPAATYEAVAIGGVKMATHA